MARHLGLDAIAGVPEQSETCHTFQLVEDDFKEGILAHEQHERRVDEAGESENDVDEGQGLETAIQLIDGLTDEAVFRSDVGQVQAIGRLNAPALQITGQPPVDVLETAGQGQSRYEEQAIAGHRVKHTEFAQNGRASLKPVPFLSVQRHRDLRRYL